MQHRPQSLLDALGDGAARQAKLVELLRGAGPFGAARTAGEERQARRHPHRPVERVRPRDRERQLAGVDRIEPAGGLQRRQIAAGRDRRRPERAASGEHRPFLGGDGGVELSQLRRLPQRLGRHEVAKDGEREGIVDIGVDRCGIRQQGGIVQVDLGRLERLLQRAVQQTVQRDLGDAARRARFDHGPAVDGDLVLPTDHLGRAGDADPPARLRQLQVRPREGQVLPLDPLEGPGPEHVQIADRRAVRHVEPQLLAGLLARRLHVALDGRAGERAVRVQELRDADRSGRRPDGCRPNELSARSRSIVSTPPDAVICGRNAERAARTACRPAATDRSAAARSRFAATASRAADARLSRRVTFGGSS